MRIGKVDIIADGKNEKGDLFGIAVSDLFHAIGYGQAVSNIARTGREVDLIAYHRIENRIAIAEFKAHDSKIGGADLNKFFGVYDTEKRKLKRTASTANYETVGYFVSLSGFKDSAIEQEKEFDEKRFVLIGPDQLIAELIAAKIIVSPEYAISNVKFIDESYVLLNVADLILTDLGWIWILYYSNSNGINATHFALIHAEGQPLIYELAMQVVKSVPSDKYSFNNLILLNNAKKLDDNFISKAKSKYYDYLESELGEIHFEGLPTDKESGTVKVRLEDIFIPLHLKRKFEKDESKMVQLDLAKSESVGNVLAANSRVAILAKPGGGKSTLLKRIAIAYAFPHRRAEIDDHLPDKQMLPIFLRCRELGANVGLSINEIIDTIPTRAEIPNHSKGFKAIVSESLQTGEALLLIDGLDEITEDKSRVAFVNQLRTFIATYPLVNLIITSREAGFRVVAGSLAIYCEQYSVSNLSPEEIESLCVKWHYAVIDQSKNTEVDAKKLARIILNDPRIAVIASNPLLLTTLLFVKRWVGYIPTKRSVLYQEMIKLLLVTWNVEGHEMLDIEEAEPQLAYIAQWMTNNGLQTITSGELYTCLVEARKELPEILSYTKISPHEFIKRVESRSSLLILSGHKQTDSGLVTAVYEFLHLSFQEYLAAKALAKGYLTMAEQNISPVALLKARVYEEKWKEVIPLATVLMERNSRDFIKFLVNECSIAASKSNLDLSKEERLLPALLGHCLSNEIQIDRKLLEEAVYVYAKNIYYIQGRNLTEILLNTKFGSVFREVVRERYFQKFDDKYISPIGSLLADIYLIDSGLLQSEYEYFTLLLELVQSCPNDREMKSICSLLYMSLSFEHRSESFEGRNFTSFKKIYDIFIDYLLSNDDHLDFSICWSFAWATSISSVDGVRRDRLIYKLGSIWLSTKLLSTRRVAGWALVQNLDVSTDLSELAAYWGFSSILLDRFSNPQTNFDSVTSALICLLTGQALDVEEVAEVFSNANKTVLDDKVLKLFADRFAIPYAAAKADVDFDDSSVFEDVDTIDDDLHEGAGK